MNKKTIPLFFLCLSVAGAWAEEDTPLKQRAHVEEQWDRAGAPLLPHKANYILPISYNSNPNNAPHNVANDPPAQETEAKFQISIKAPIGRKLIRGEGDLFFGYTQLSMWQLYNTRNSAPFRETNYEPELFLSFNTDFVVGNFSDRIVNVGLVHQSNGRADPVSRNWNRLYVEFILEMERLVVSVKPWIRIPTPPDDNPNIDRYMGHGEWRFAFPWRGKTVSLMLRDNLRVKGNKGALELDYSYPLNKNLKGYVQFFSGYGETLIDYNHPINRLGIGLALSDWP